MSGRLRIQLARAALRRASLRAQHALGVVRNEQVSIPVVQYLNNRGETIRGIIDVYGDPRGAPAVVIPPAWGRTKETLLPLAAAIIETFRRAKEPIAVLRFDGTHRRGESYIDPGCRLTGEEYLHFTFSGAVRDIQASVDFLCESPNIQSSRVVLVTFSLAAVEGRRALTLDATGRFAGWISVVGMVDLQSALRTISGGIDYAYGLLRGVRFGRHELVGVVSDMDHTGLDALENRMVFLEDARRDMASIEVPVTWIHGRHDAWMDVERVRDVMSRGKTENRKIIEVPTGHQLRSSRVALETFGLISEEISEMLLERRIPSQVPNLALLDQRRNSERSRLPKLQIDLRSFWSNYLLGRDRRLGMQLITATRAYREFMQVQIRELGLKDGMRVADLGAGTGDFPIHLHRDQSASSDLEVDEIDYIDEALRRGRERLSAEFGGHRARVSRILANLDSECSARIPVRDSSYDAVLASLLISYLDDRGKFLEEMFRVLRPGGQLVLSSLRRDADVSKLYTDGMRELERIEARRQLGEEAVMNFNELARDFLNDASRLLDLEECGQFVFWEEEEFARLVRGAGFTHVRTKASFGDPAQAVVVSAIRPS